jgi:hypothetical protein
MKLKGHKGRSQEGEGYPEKKEGTREEEEALDKCEDKLKWLPRTRPYASCITKTGIYE